MTNEEQNELLNKIWNDGKWGDYCNPNKTYDLTPTTLFYHINNLLKTRSKENEEKLTSLLQDRQEKMVEKLKNYDRKKHICRFNDGEQNCDCFYAGIDKAIGLISQKDN